MFILQDFTPRKLKQNWLLKYFLGGGGVKLLILSKRAQGFLIIKESITRKFLNSAKS